MQAETGLVGRLEFVEKFVEQRVLGNIFECLALVNDLLDKAFLNCDDAVVGHLGRQISEKSMNHQVEDLVHSERIFGQLLCTVGHQKFVCKGIKDLLMLPEETKELVDSVCCVF